MQTIKEFKYLNSSSCSQGILDRNMINFHYTVTFFALQFFFTAYIDKFMSHSCNIIKEVDHTKYVVFTFKELKFIYSN